MDKKDLPFGQRYGFESVELKIQMDSIDEHLKTDLYNGYILYVDNNFKYADRRSEHIFEEQHEIIWKDFFRLRLDKFPEYHSHFLENVEYTIYRDKWYRAYQFFEFLFQRLEKNYYNMDEFKIHVNDVLERNNSGYRVVEDHFVPISNNEEIIEIVKARDNASRANILGLGEHLNSSISLLSKKPDPDLRNSIKESISMVEAVCRTIEPQNTLGKALNKIETKGQLNPVLKSSFEKLYAYSNDKDGIRHALMNEHDLGVEDARYFLIACSAFSNYLIDKGRKKGLINIS